MIHNLLLELVVLPNVLALVAHVILVSAQGPNPSFFFFWGILFDLGACLDKGLDSDLDQGLTIIVQEIRAG